LVSDVFLRERTDRLIEFAVGSAEHEYHVMHLHGRADRHETMVVSYRDYDRLYRRSGTSKVPFEHALGLLYSGNPVLFVGIGMSESEINQSLQDVVGDHPYRRVMPTFLLWNADMTLSEEARKADKAIKRIDMLHRLGVLTLFDDDLARHAGVDLLEGETTERLARSIENLAAAMARRGDEH
ncbi:SIR2 family protein, partial [Pseudomonas canadensis]|uniref:SIR2 family protein n=8 Tax=Pseudomonadota TaxID=1224 RepID=UPI0030DD9B9E